MFGRPPVPRQALLAATLGALFGILLLPTSGRVVLAGFNLEGVGWFFISVGLLFVIPLAYHVFTFWAILWIVARGAAFFRAGDSNFPLLILDLILPLASLALLFTSHYMDAARPADL